MNDNENRRFIPDSRDFRKALPCLIAAAVWTSAMLLVPSVSASGGQDGLEPVRIKPVRIGVLAKRGPQRCLEKWAPTAEYLTSQIPGHSFEIVPLDYDGACQALQRKEVEFILSNPVLYVAAEQLHGARRLATLKNMGMSKDYTIYGGVVFCKAGRKDIACLDDLEGKTFMAVDKMSLGGWIAAWREIEENGIVPHRDFADLQFGGTHDAVVFAVLGGEADAGSVRTDTLERMESEGKISLKQFQVIHHHGCGCLPLPFLHSTRLYPEWPFAKASHTSDELAEKVAAALMRMTPDTPAAQSARCAGWTIPHNYRPVRECLKELRVSPYENYGQVTLAAIVHRYWPWLVGAVVLLIVAYIVSAYLARLNRRLRRILSEYGRELTERRRAEKSLQAVSKYTRNLIEATLDPLVTIGPDGKITDANRATEEATGVSREKLIGSNFSNYFTEPQKAKEGYQRVFSEGFVRDYPLDIRHASGSVRNVLYNATVFQNQSGEAEEVFAAARDVTKRKWAEQRYQVLFESSRDAIMTLAPPSWKFTSGNPAAVALFGVKDQAEFVSLGLWELSPETQPDGSSSAQGAKENIGKAMREGSHFFEWTHKRLGGEEFPATVLLARMKIGGRTLLQATVRDITERRIIERELAQAQKLESIGQLAAGIAHEINTPVQYVGDNTRFLQGAFGDFTTLFGKFDQLLQAAKDGTLTDGLIVEVEAAVREIDLDYLAEEIPTAIEQSLEGIGRVATIVRAMKEFSHPGSDRKQAIDLNRAIENTLIVSRNEWKYIAKMATNFDQSLSLVPCFPNEFNQVVLNLVVNAAHAIADVVGDGSESKGTITITTRRDGDWAEIRIEDTGTGIREEDREKVFDHFFTTKDVGKGTGQGLTIAYSTVVEKHGGTITFETEVGRGTTFIVRLPITDPDESDDPDGVVQHEPAEAAC